jgi:tRNA A37 threonylcarbamoyladenosine dehydratase
MSSNERTKILVGDSGISKLKNAHVTICGVGGVGGACAESLVRAGVGEVTIIDFDTIDTSNINRQIVALHSNVGKPKVEVLGRRLADINPRCIIHTKQAFIKIDEAQEIAQGNSDFVADCIDSIFYKVMLIENCITFDKKIISSMGAGGRLDASKVAVVKMEKTTNCGLAREVRKRLRDKRISLKFPVVFSNEIGIKALPHKNIPQDEIASKGRPKAVNGTISYMPNVFGLHMASYIINNILFNKSI